MKTGKVSEIIRIARLQKLHGKKRVAQSVILKHPSGQ